MLEATGWPLRVREPLAVTEPPTARELEELPRAHGLGSRASRRPEASGSAGGVEGVREVARLADGGRAAAASGRAARRRTSSRRPPATRPRCGRPCARAARCRCRGRARCRRSRGSSRGRGGRTSRRSAPARRPGCRGPRRGRRSRRCPSAGWTPTWMRPPSGEYLIAFSTRLTSTWRTRSRSAATGGVAVGDDRLEADARRPVLARGLDDALDEVAGVEGLLHEVEAARRRAGWPGGSR